MRLTHFKEGTMLDQAAGFSVTTGSFPSSRKIHIKGEAPGVNVAMREIALTGNELPLNVYDTSGAYSDPEAKIDITKGLAQLRREWILGRGDVEEYPGR